MAKKALVVDDEKNITDIIKYNLKKENFDVITAHNGEDAVSLAFSENPDIILLDIMMPKLDGFDACRKIREKLSTPIIMITAKSEEVDKVLGLELGADDYVTKPFGVRELIARVKANLRRNASEVKTSEESLRYGELEIFPDRWTVCKKNEEIALTLREYELLKFLAQYKPQVFSRENLLEKVWGYEYYGDVRTVDVTVRRLREKIEDEPGKPSYILTKRGVGYYFEG